MKFRRLTLLLLTHAFASDSSKNSSKSNETTPVKNAFSHLNTLEEIQEKAAAVTSTFLNSIKEVPNPRPFYDKFKFIIDDIADAAKFARKAQKHFSSESDCYQKLQSVYESAMSSREKLRKDIKESAFGTAKSSRSKLKQAPREKSVESNEKNKLYDTCVSRRNQAVEGIFSTLQAINFTQSSFEWLNGFSSFVFMFAVEFNLNEDDTSDFNQTMRALNNRKNEIDVLASKIDWNNIDRTYASHTNSLVELIGKIDIPKETNSRELSHAVHVLANAVKAYAKLSSNREDMMPQIKAIIDQEKETSRLYRTYKSMNNIDEDSFEEGTSKKKKATHIYVVNSFE